MTGPLGGFARLRRRARRRRSRRLRHGSGAPGFAGRAFARQPRQIGDRRRLREGRLVDRRLGVLLDRHQQLDALERAEAQRLDRRVRPDVGAARCEALHRGEDGVGAAIGGRGSRRRRVAVDPALHLAPFQLARAVGARQLGARPHRGAADLLVIAQRLVGALHDRVEIDAGIDAGIGDDHRVDALLAVPGPADDRRVPDAGDRGERALDVLGEDVQPLGRDDHLLLAALDVDAPLLVGAADVAGVQPAVGEGLRRGLGRAVVALGDVVAADEDLAVLGDLHLDAGDRLADRSAARLERMVERDDGRGLGQAVALHHEEAEASPGTPRDRDRAAPRRRRRPRTSSRTRGAPGGTSTTASTSASGRDPARRRAGTRGRRARAARRGSSAPTRAPRCAAT